jgi:hypothetical protein
MSFPRQPNEDPNYYVVKDPTSNTSGVRQRIADENNYAFHTNNKAHRDCPYGSSGHIYSTGKRY